MLLDTSIDTIGYRTKGPEHSFRSCCFRLSGPLLKLLGDPERLGVLVAAPTDDTAWNVHIFPHSQGFKLSRPAGAQIGEFDVAWSRLDAMPHDDTGKGILPCHFMRVNRLPSVVANAISWRQHNGVQDTLFGKWGVVLLPEG